MMQTIIQPERVTALFSALVSIDSRSLEERAVCDYVQAFLKRLDIAAEEDDAGRAIGGNCGNLHAFIQGTLPGEPLLFCAHMDTVEPSAGKRAIVEPDGVIHSDGTTVLGADDCAGLAAILEALRILREQKLPHRSIELLFTVAEELYCKGGTQLDLERLRAKQAYILDLSGPIGTAAYRAPTILSFQAMIQGKASHAGFAPQEGVHAIAAAADAISRLQMGRLDPQTTLNIGTIEGGTATNIVPDSCIVRGEIRSYVHETALQAVARVREQFADSAAAIGAEAVFTQEILVQAYETAADSPVVRRFEAACGACGLSPQLVPTFGGSDHNHLAQHGISGLVIANAMHKCHSGEEYTTVQELCQVTQLTLELMCAED